MHTLTHTLLNSDETTLVNLLEELDVSSAAPAKDALILLWQIHPDNAVKEKALDLLETCWNKGEKEQVENTFLIFKSIIEHLPWMGDYADLQADNFTKFAQNKNTYEALLVQSSVLVESYLDLGRKLYMMFDLVDEAKMCFEGIVQYSPSNDEALYALGRLAEKNEQMEQALDFYERCVQHNPEHIYGLLQLGILRANVLESYEGAIACYDKVIELEPFMVETHIRTAEAHYALGDVKRTKQFIEVALDINEYNEDALNLLGQIQWHHENDIEAAMETFQKGLDHKIHGDSGVLLASLGDLYNTHLGDYEKAKICYEKSLKAAPKQPQTLQKLVTILENIYQDYGAVSLHYENYLLIDKKNAIICADYAAFLVKYMHDYNYAKVHIDNALTIDPTNEKALKIMRQIGEYIDDDLDTDFDIDHDDCDDDDDDDEFVGGGASGDN